MDGAVGIEGSPSLRLIRELLGDNTVFVPESVLDRLDEAGIETSTALLAHIEAYGGVIESLQELGLKIDDSDRSMIEGWLQGNGILWTWCQAIARSITVCESDPEVASAASAENGSAIERDGDVSSEALPAPQVMRQRNVAPQVMSSSEELMFLLRLNAVDLALFPVGDGAFFNTVSESRRALGPAHHIHSLLFDMKGLRSPSYFVVLEHKIAAAERGENGADYLPGGVHYDALLVVKTFLRLLRLIAPLPRERTK